jgi:uncharacterized integral membrane protein
MWIIKWIFSAVIILVVLGFALQNQTEKVSLTFVTDRYVTEPIPVWLVVYASFGVGVLFWLFVSISQVIQLKLEVRRVRKDNERLRKELDGLRNLSIEEELVIPETGAAQASVEMDAAPVKATSVSTAPGQAVG